VRESASHFAERIRQRFNAERAAQSVGENAQRTSDRSRILHNALLAAHVLRSGDHGGAGPGPSLKE